MTPAYTHSYPGEAGRASALVVYGLYVLSIPSAAIFALIGVIWAYAARDGAEGVARTHLDNAIRFWWTAFWWGAALIVAGLIGAALTIVLVGFPILWLAAVAAFLVMVWFTIKSVLGMLALLDGRPARP